jgi:hypothetical protein
MKTSTFIWHIGNIGFEAILFAVRFVGEGAWALGRLVLGSMAAAEDTHDESIKSNYWVKRVEEAYEEEKYGGYVKRKL